MYDNLKPSYEEIHNACKDIAQRIDKSFLNITHIAGIVRGGLYPALILSHMLDAPLVTLDYSSKDGKGDNRNHRNELPKWTPEDGSVLIVDDICDSGKTLNEIVYHFTRQNVAVYTAVLYYKTHDQQTMIPDYVWKTIPYDSGWVVFPYERNEYLEPDFQGPSRHLQSLVRN